MLLATIPQVALSLDEDVEMTDVVIKMLNDWLKANKAKTRNNSVIIYFCNHMSISAYKPQMSGLFF